MGLENLKNLEKLYLQNTGLNNANQLDPLLGLSKLTELWVSEPDPPLDDALKVDMQAAIAVCDFF
jgi:Leucine-rich repeat (LRR) protein